MYKKIILASSSIHRKRLLRQLKISFLSISPNIDEKRLKSESQTMYVKRLSKEKAMFVCSSREIGYQFYKNVI